MESERLQVVPAGDLVYVAEVKRRRARILKPVLGRVSLQTKGVRPDMAYSKSANHKIAMENAFKSRGHDFCEASKRLKGSVAKMTAMCNTCRRVRAMPPRGPRRSVGLWPRRPRMSSRRR